MTERDLAPLLTLARFAVAGDSAAARDYIARWLSEHPVADGSATELREELAELLLETRTATSQPARAKRARLPSSRNEAIFSERSPAESIPPSASVPRMTAAAWSDARSADPSPTESYSAVTHVETVSAPERPVLRRPAAAALDAIIEERGQVEALRRHGLEPTRSLLLTGAPGVGKTMSARYLAGTLGVPLISIDLATLMSSYLGETGRNLRRALDVARGIPCVFLIDEIDALAKRRSDAAEMGELKRIVNVLLLELERWPGQSLLIGATNHPELLDRAIWRRFDRVVALGRPGQRARRQLLEHTMESHGRVATNRALSITVAATEGSSAAALCQLAREAVRGSILGEIRQHRVEVAGEVAGRTARNGGDPDGSRAAKLLSDGQANFDTLLVQLAMTRLERVCRKHPEVRGAFCALAISELGLTQREIGRELGISHVSVGRLARAWTKSTLTRPHQTDTDG